MPLSKIQVGIISWGQSTTCQDTGIVGFTRVSTFVPWIYFHICQLSRFGTGCNYPIPSPSGTSPVPAPRPTENPRPQSAPTPDCALNAPFLKERLPTGLYDLLGTVSSQFQLARSWWNSDDEDGNA